VKFTKLMTQRKQQCSIWCLDVVTTLSYCPQRIGWQQLPVRWKEKSPLLYVWLQPSAVKVFVSHESGETSDGRWLSRGAT